MGNMRWDPYLMNRGPRFQDFWNERLGSSKKRVLFILGRSFDPRSCECLEKLVRCSAGKSSFVCHVIVFDEGPSSPSNEYETDVRSNLLRIISAADGNVEERRVTMWAESGITQRRTTSVSASRLYGSL